MTGKPSGLDLLRVPFPTNQISKLPKPTKAQTDAVKADFRAGIRCQICGAWHHKDVVHLDYVGHAALTDRLLACDDKWDWHPLALGPDGLPALDKSGGMWIKLTVCGHTRLGYGSADGKSGGDAVKELIGDALRNAAMRFGAALDLWHKGDLHASDDEPVISPPKDEPKAAQKKQSALITADQFLALRDRAEQAGVDESVIAKAASIDDLRGLPASMFEGAMKKLQLTIDKQPKPGTDIADLPY
jgi:hypothetical protein